MISIPSIQPTKQEQTITNLHRALEQSEAHRKQLSLENSKLQQQLQWQRRLFSNPHLSASQKLALWATTEEIQKGNPNEQGLTHVNITYVSKKIGMSPKTTGRNLQELADAKGLTRKEVNFIQSNGNPGTNIYFAPTEQTSQPHLIQPPQPRNHGGVRQRCKDCGSENLIEQITITCMNCGAEQHRSHRLINKDATEIQSTGRQPDHQEPPAQPIDNLTPVLQPKEPLDNLTSGIQEPATPPDTAQPCHDPQAVTELLLVIAGDRDEHIVMNTNSQVAKKYLTVHRPLCLEDMRQHLQGKKTIGATLSYQDGTTRSLCFDTDTPDGYQQLQESSILLHAAGYKPLLEPSPAGRGGHLWIIFTERVNAYAAYTQVCSIAPTLKAISEYWPQQRGNQKVRLLAGKYTTPTFAQWCHLYNATGHEISTRDFLDYQTPADLLPALRYPTEPEPSPDHLTKCDRSPVTKPPPDTGVDEYHRQKYPHNHFWFAWTPQQLADWYNTKNSVYDLLSPEKNGNGLAQWRGERTASVAFRHDSAWVDFGATARQPTGKQDGGDCLELAVRIEQRPKAEIMREAAKLLLTEGRAALEDAARAGEGIPAWLLPFLTEKGWNHYERIRSQAGGVVGFKQQQVPIHEEVPIPARNPQKHLPTWESLTQEKNERGLPIYCSQCGSFATWYGAGGVPYCTQHWQHNEKNRPIDSLPALNYA